VDIDGNVIGEGAHRTPGEPHAEALALAMAGEAAAGSTVYTTLEPCNFHGRTPPCADALIAASVARVVVGATDPDIRVAGGGIAALRAASIEVVEGVLEDEVRDLDPSYFHHRATGMPLVTIKYGMTLDGMVAALDGTSKWITSEAAREDAHRLRSEADAVIVGAGTLRTDDPLLDVRLDGYQGQQPRPVVVAGSDSLPEIARLWDREPIVVSTVELRVPAGDNVVVGGAEGRPDPRETCSRLAELGLLSLLVEGGPTLAAAWWHAGVVERGVVYVGARMAGGLGRTPMGAVFENIGDAEVVSITAVRTLGSDVRIDFKRQ
jgi:diaminohydroxyphosphoribosylaminopyrimidine deaminase / 5-amino-6-(5-phosphoribosylamino)uracil reductase